MWNSIKGFIFESPFENKLSLDKMEEIYLTSIDVEVEQSIEQLSKGSKVIESALAHYCRYCDTGHKTRGTTKNHIRLKHPEHYVNPATNQELPQAE